MRLDALLVQRGLAESRSKAQALIMAGKVRVNDSVVTKAGAQTAIEAKIDIEHDLPYVSRGGLKLATALDTFQFSPNGMICADVGASTGGFTDVLLQRDAARIYAIDVGYGQLAWKLRQDEHVVILERTNVRYLENLPEPIDLVTIDVSFISLKLILPAVQKWLKSPAWIIALIKPQFEAGREQVGKGGLVRDRAIHKKVLTQVMDFTKSMGFELLGLIPSPITGPAGNHEFLLYLGWETFQPSSDLTMMLDSCFSILDSMSL